MVYQTISVKQGLHGRFGIEKKRLGKRLNTEKTQQSERKDRILISNSKILFRH